MTRRVIPGLHLAYGACVGSSSRATVVPGRAMSVHQGEFLNCPRHHHSLLIHHLRAHLRLSFVACLAVNSLAASLVQYCRLILSTEGPYQYLPVPSSPLPPTYRYPESVARLSVRKIACRGNVQTVQIAYNRLVRSNRANNVFAYVNKGSWYLGHTNAPAEPANAPRGAPRSACTIRFSWQARCTNPSLRPTDGADGHILSHSFWNLLP